MKNPTKDQLLENTALRLLFNEAKHARSVLSDKEWADSDSDFHKKCRSDLSLKAEQSESAIFMIMQFDDIQSENTALKLEVEKLKESLGVSEPWNVIHVIEKLAEATDFLLNHRNYDRTGWEEIAHCVELGREYGDKITEALKPK